MSSEVLRELVAGTIAVVGGGAILLIARGRKKSRGQSGAARRWCGKPMPFFFQEQTAKAFQALDMREDDVVLSSMVKGGTTWMHKIVHLMLHGIDDEGVRLPSSGIGAKSQCYPDALVLRRGAPCDPLTTATADKTRKEFFGEWGFEDDMCGQPEPRLFSTHAFGEMLPAQLLAADGKGRLIIVLRNLKDVLVSLHFFRGEAKDGWLGNKHGPGSLARFLDPDTPNAYGSCFDMVRAADAAMQTLGQSGRCHIVFYEALVRNLDKELERLATFLKMPLPEAKKSAISKAVSFDAMKASGDTHSMLLRKGIVGDWRSHLSTADWARFDAAFDEALEGVAAAEPLRYYQIGELEGKPPPRKEHSQKGSDDPRKWPTFERKVLQDGHVVRDKWFADSKAGLFQRKPSEFDGVVSPPGTTGAKHVAEPGRYHLWVSGVCPWASSTRAVRHLLGLDEVISMDVADGQSGGGWVFLEGTTCPPWAGRPGPWFAHEAYQHAEHTVTARITVPILWDKKLGCIVSNDSWNIVKMLATAFAPLGKPRRPVDLYPAGLAAEIESTHKRLYDGLMNGVYKAGITLLRGDAAVAQSAASGVHRTLAELETALSSRRYLLGDQLTAVDIRLLMTLLRYDAAYRAGFNLDQGDAGGILVSTPGTIGYPTIAAYIRDIYADIVPTVDWPSFRQYYRWAPTPNLSKQDPLPDLDGIIASASLPHKRTYAGARR